MALVTDDVYRQRRLPRVPYSAPVRLSGELSDREPCFVPVLAQSLDLSEGGMAVVTPLRLPQGSSVACSMRVGGCQLYVVGSVVWQRVGDDGLRRLGIQFLPPCEADTDLMRRLLHVGREHPHRIAVRFDGRPDTLTALAQVTPKGLSLTAPLPILRRDTGVRFAFLRGASRGHERGRIEPSFVGRIEQVRLSQLGDMPALQVSVRVADVSAVRNAATDRSRPTSTPGERDDVTPRSVEVLAPLPILPHPLAARVMHAGRQLSARLATLRVPTRVAAWLSAGAITLGAVAQHVVEGAAPTPPAVQHAIRYEPEAEPEAEVGYAAATAPAAVTRAAATTAAPATRQQAAPKPFIDAPEPNFKWRRERREIFVPLSGDLTQLTVFQMRSPEALAIDAPLAQGQARNSRIAVRKPGVRRLDIHQSAEGARIRVWLAEPLSDYRVQAEDGGLRITLLPPFSPR